MALDQAWDELSAAEVLAALQRLQGTGRSAVSGFLDTHQWLDLQSRPEVQLVGGAAVAQFRRAGLSSVPAVAIWRMELAAIPASQRSARQLRRLLNATSGATPAAGDLMLDHGQAIFAATAEWEPAADWSLTLLPGWPDPSDPPGNASLAALRLDAVVAACFRISRAEAVSAIDNGYVFLNYARATKAARQVAVGDQLVLRGKGRAQLLSAQTNLRSGRVRAEYRVYPC